MCVWGCGLLIENTISNLKKRTWRKFINVIERELSKIKRFEMRLQSNISGLFL